MKDTRCPKCDHQESQPFEVCPNCGLVIAKYMRHVPANVARRARASASTPTPKAPLIATAVGVVLGLFILIGNVHFINGSSYQGSWIVKKASFGFSETFINTDKIEGTPYITAVARYPLSVKTLQRIGHFESNEAREARARRELQRATERQTRDLEQAERYYRQLINGR